MATKHEARQEARDAICREIEIRLGLEAPDFVSDDAGEVYSEECYRIADRIRTMYGVPEPDYMKGFINNETRRQEN